MKSVEDLALEHGATVRGEEVVMSLDDFARLVRYANELKAANDKLNAQIEAYNDQFAKFDPDEEDEHAQPWLD